jgi:hypothetical protein
MPNSGGRGRWISQASSHSLVYTLVLGHHPGLHSKTLISKQSKTKQNNLIKNKTKTKPTSHTKPNRTFTILIVKKISKEFKKKKGLTDRVLHLQSFWVFHKVNAHIITVLQVKEISLLLFCLRAPGKRWDNQCLDSNKHKVLNLLL